MGRRAGVSVAVYEVIRAQELKIAMTFENDPLGR
jgi:hypothetical protein